MLGGEAMRDFRKIQLALRPVWGPHTHAQELTAAGDAVELERFRTRSN